MLLTNSPFRRILSAQTPTRTTALSPRLGSSSFSGRSCLQKPKTNGHFSQLLKSPFTTRTLTVFRTPSFFRGPPPCHGKRQPTSQRPGKSTYRFMLRCKSTISVSIQSRTAPCMDGGANWSQHCCGSFSLRTTSTALPTAWTKRSSCLPASNPLASARRTPRQRSPYLPSTYKCEWKKSLLPSLLDWQKAIPGEAAQSLTATIFGDPPPGRGFNSPAEVASRASQKDKSR